MKNIFGAARFQKLLPLCLVLVLPTFAQAHPGVSGHTHTLTTVMSDGQAGVVLVAAVVALGLTLWVSRRQAK